MNRLFSFVLSVSICTAMIVLTGCPVSSKFPLGPSGVEKMDERLVGTWKNNEKDAEAAKITITKKSDYQYKLVVDEKGESFMADATVFNAWLTKLEGMTFLVLQETKSGAGTETYYVYHVGFSGSKMVSHDIALKVKGTDAITSIEAYREEVSASMKKDDFLAGKIEWTK